MTDMQTIQQEGVTTTRNVSLATKNRDFFDDFNATGFSSRSKYVFISKKNKIHFIYSLVMICYHQEIKIDMMRILESTKILTYYTCMCFSNILFIE
jgi:hypothetical protein